MPISQHEAPAFFGEIPVLTDEATPENGRSPCECRLYKLSQLGNSTGYAEVKNLGQIFLHYFPAS